MTFTSPDRIRTHVGVVLACVPALALSPALSANGRYVAFESYSSDLTGGTDPFYVLTSGVFV
ncbi:MAG: hypothetical protein IT198_16570 [Acidimicrobiia bacterium]|nr:hypothetical protein [Acidimicrobiia bacterium]